MIMCAHYIEDELSRVKKELIDCNAQHTNALGIIEKKDQELRERDNEIDDLQKQLKVRTNFLYIPH